MQKNVKDKMMVASSKEENAGEQSFFFPDYQLTIVASSQEDAETKLRKHLGGE